MTKPFGERKHWLHDDYVKFIALAEKMIRKNGEGILGFITNHGYLDNPTFRGMRWHLQETFDKVYIIDLHGNSKKKEIAPNGLSDKDVFDIQQGVAIVIAVKKSDNNVAKGKLFYSELWGQRSEKNNFLKSESIKTVKYKKLKPQLPYMMFYDVNYEALEQYDTGFSVADLFKLQSTGIITARDDLAVNFSNDDLESNLTKFLDKNISDDLARNLFFKSTSSKKYLPGDSRSWSLSEMRPVLRKINLSNKIENILYRPFDVRSIVYTPEIVDWPRHDTMFSFNQNDNIALLTPRMTADNFSPLVSESIISNKTGSRYDQSYFFPLYIYPDDNALDQTRLVNMESKIRSEIEEAAQHPKYGEVDEVAIFDYIYGVLHSPVYRSTYAEFLKIDFPRIPYPTSSDSFWDIAAKGSELRKLHLMTGVDSGTDYPFKGAAPEEGSGYVDTIGKKSYQLSNKNHGNVFINETQYFEGVPFKAWEFFIGGYQPAQKWLKDRKGRTLSFDDRMHYRKIIHVLMETDRIMQSIEMDL